MARSRIIHQDLIELPASHTPLRELGQVTSFGQSAQEVSSVSLPGGKVNYRSANSLSFACGDC